MTNNTELSYAEIAAAMPRVWVFDKDAPPLTVALGRDELGPPPKGAVKLDVDFITRRRAADTPDNFLLPDPRILPWLAESLRWTFRPDKVFNIVVNFTLVPVGGALSPGDYPRVSPNARDPVETTRRCARFFGKRGFALQTVNDWFIAGIVGAVASSRFFAPKLSGVPDSVNAAIRAYKSFIQNEQDLRRWVRIVQWQAADRFMFDQISSCVDVLPPVPFEDWPGFETDAQRKEFERLRFLRCGPLTVAFVNIARSFTMESAEEALLNAEVNNK